MTVKTVKTLHKQNMKGAIINVQPLRSGREITEMIEALAMSPNNGARNVLLFKIGISTGLRVSDIVKLRVEDVRGRASFKVREGKTQKERTVYLNAINRKSTRLNSSHVAISYAVFCLRQHRTSWDDL